MRPVPDSVKKKILELWLRGTTYRQISAMTGASIGAISEIIREYRQRTPDLEELRKLHLALREAKINLPDALRGARFLRSLDELEFDSKRLPECLKFVKHAGGHASELASAGIRLIELEKKAGKPYEQMLQESDEKLKAEAESSKRVKTLEDKELKLRTSIRYLDKLSMLQETMDKHNITPIVLESLIGDGLRLQALGFTPQHAEILGKALLQVGMDPATASAQVGKLLRDCSDLAQAKTKAEAEAKNWAAQVETTKKSVLLLRMELNKLEENYANRKTLLEKEHEALESKLKAEFDADKQKLTTQKQEIESEIRHLQSQATTLRTELQDLESTKGNSREAEEWLQKIEESIGNLSMLGVIVSLIKDPATLKSRSEVLEAAHAILDGFKRYLEASSFTRWKNKSNLERAIDLLVEELR